MQSAFKIKIHQRSARGWLLGFAVALFLSGVTAIPLPFELSVLNRWFPKVEWLQKVAAALADVHHRYPFLLYGTDWLAFAHFVLAILFVGAARNPMRNKWVVEFGLIACSLVIPFALYLGNLRGIPFWWRLIDCSFGILGWLPLGMAWHHIRKGEEAKPVNVWA